MQPCMQHIIYHILYHTIRSLVLKSYLEQSLYQDCYVVMYSKQQGPNFVSEIEIVYQLNGWFILELSELRHLTRYYSIAVSLAESRSVGFTEVIKTP